MQKHLFKVIDKNTYCSLVEMKPITGRKHQLRKTNVIIRASNSWR